MSLPIENDFWQVYTVLTEEADLRLTITETDTNNPKSWNEYYKSTHEKKNKNEVTCEKAIRFAKNIIELFNNTLGPNELPRKLLSVEIKKTLNGDWEFCDINKE